MGQPSVVESDSQNQSTEEKSKRLVAMVAIEKASNEKISQNKRRKIKKVSDLWKIENRSY